MPPAKPKTAKAAAVATVIDPDDGFVLWDELVADAQVDRPPFRLRVSADEVIQIPCPTGKSYLELTEAQRRFDVVGIMRAMFPDKALRERVETLMAGADFPIIDRLSTKVLNHYFGLSDDPGN